MYYCLDKNAACFFVKLKYNKTKMKFENKPQIK